MAQAIAYAILGTLNENQTNAESSEEEPLYRVQVGSFRQREYADQLLYELQDQGFPAFILNQNGYYRVQVGAFKQLSNAVKMEQALRRAGYSTWITQ